ncbi:MAG: caspase family protein [Nitrospira sp.]|nr:caspase family protein [Nitrospira sp.]
MLEGTRRAVIVGINKYKNPGIPELMGAENDARELYERLGNRDIGNFQIAEDHYLPGDEATAQRIRKAISDVFWNTDDPCDLALFYFSGHGLVYGGDEGYIAPYDFSKTDPFVCGVSIPEFKRVVSRSTASSVIIILDCCYSGVATKGEKAIADYRTAYESTLETLSGEGRIIFASSSPDQTSREIIQRHINEEEPHAHGAFSYHLIQGLDGSASDEAGVINLRMLETHLETQFKYNQKQTPRFFRESSNLGAIQIAVATEKYNRNMRDKIENALDNLARKDFAGLFRAVKDVDSLLNVNGKHKEGLALRTNCQTSLDAYKSQMQKWLSDNILDLNGQLRFVYNELDSLVDRLDFAVTAKLEGRDGTLITLLSRAVTSEITKEQFVTKCRPYDNTESRQQTISRSAAAG